jgi:hypothetical protein
LRLGRSLGRRDQAAKPTRGIGEGRAHGVAAIDPAATLAPRRRQNWSGGLAPRCGRSFFGRSGRWLSLAAMSSGHGRYKP